MSEEKEHTCSWLTAGASRATASSFLGDRGPGRVKGHTVLGVQISIAIIKCSIGIWGVNIGPKFS